MNGVRCVCVCVSHLIKLKIVHTYSERQQFIWDSMTAVMTMTTTKYREKTNIFET